MPLIYVGNQQIPAGQLYVGGIPLSEVYVGSQKVWPPVVGGGTNTLALYRTADPVTGLYLPYNGWIPGALPPPSGDHSHFDLISASPNVVTGANSLSGFGTWSLRSTADIAAVGNANHTENWSYDTGYDAALLNFFAGFSEGLTLDAGRQLWMDFARVNVAAGNTFSFQWEIMYDAPWQDTTLVPAFSGVQKTIRLDHRAASALLDERVFEMNNESIQNFSKDYAAMPRLRSYIQPRDPLAPPYDQQRADESLSCDHSAFLRRYPFALQGWTDGGTIPPQTTDQDRQPSIRTSLDRQLEQVYRDNDHVLMAGGDVNRPALHRNNIWARMTAIWKYFAPGELRFELWLADEQTDPVQIFGHKDTADGKAGTGFNTWNAGSVVYGGIPGSGQGGAGDYNEDNAIDRVRAEFNSSGGGNPPPVDFKIWLRNCCAWSSATGETIPLGGRPQKTGTIS